ELAAVLAARRLVGARRRDRPGVPGVGVAPSRRMAGRDLLEAALRRAVRVGEVGAVERGAGLGSEKAADEHARGRRREAAAALADLRAGEAACRGADQPARRCLVGAELAGARIAGLARLRACGE